ncbi:MAG: hypothetical protein M0T84_06015 [Betaproteobacteria bacterium]|nr:hypothetical protein [Betaproteobacteria bacterium]
MTRTIERRVILVCGPAGSGKTETVRLFLESLGLTFPKRPRDITVLMRVQKDDNSRNLGIASAGEEPEIVRKNLRFMNDYNWDVVVCAAKSQGVTTNEVRKFADSARAELIPVLTPKVAAHEIEAAQRRIAQKIATYVW